VLLAGCTTTTAQNAQLEAAIERFEQAAARAEAAAASAEASSQKANAAAARIEAAAAKAAAPPYAALVGSEAYRRCAAGDGAVGGAPQASGTAKRFLGCLGLTWGAIARVRHVSPPQAERDLYRVEYRPNAWDRSPAVLVGAADGEAELSLP